MRRIAVIAVLVACGPQWTLEERTTPEQVTMAPAQTHARTFAIESSHPITKVRTIAEGISVSSGVIRVVHDDSREGCSESRTFQGRDGKWNSAEESGTTSISEARLELAAACTEAYRVAQVRVSLVNEGKEPVTLRFHVVAVANGDGSDSPPSDAFVRVRPIE